MSIAKKMVRTSGPSATRMFGAARRRFMSCNGGSSTKSTSPDSSAATRVASEEIGRNTSSVTLAWVLSGSRQPYQPSLRRITVRTSCSRETRRNGPVPLAARTVCISSRARVF